MYNITLSRGKPFYRRGYILFIHIRNHFINMINTFQEVYFIYWLLKFVQIITTIFKVSSQVPIKKTIHHVRLFL